MRAKISQITKVSNATRSLDTRRCSERSFNMPPTPHNFTDIKIYTVSSRTTSTPNIKIKLYDYINYVKIIVEFYIANINIAKVLHQHGLPSPPTKTLPPP
jgi:hypothetical protein